MITLALGVQWIAHRKAIVKELRSGQSPGVNGQCRLYVTTRRLL